VRSDRLGALQEEVTGLAPHLRGAAAVSTSTLPHPDIAMIGAATLAFEAFFAAEGRWQMEPPVEDDRGVA
jgi:hypothetical protein